MELKRVRILKEMPWVRVDEDFALDKNGEWFLHPAVVHSSFAIQKMIDWGWLEWVEEDKSLEEKIEAKLLRTGETLEANVHYRSKELAQIAREHTLEVFDKAHREFGNVHIFDIRKALEDA